MSIYLANRSTAPSQVTQLALYESSGAGVQWSSLWTRENNFSMGLCLGMLALDFALYSALGCYLDQVLPQEYGTRLHPLFPLLPSYWCPRDGKRAHLLLGRRRRRRGNKSGQGGEKQQLVDPLLAGSSSGGAAFAYPDTGSDSDAEDEDRSVEPVGAELRRQVHEGRCVVLQKLRKEFEVPKSASGGAFGDGGGGGSNGKGDTGDVTGVKVAVQGLSLRMFEGQVFALLGHNGGGCTICRCIVNEATSFSFLLPMGMHVRCSWQDYDD